VGRYRVGASLPQGSDRWSVREWGEEFVVFDGVTGSCHLLSQATGAVFGALLRSPPGGMDAAQVFAAAFANDMEPPSQADEQTVFELLAGLHEAGLVCEADS
jgi:hypothetical protein